MIIEEVKEENEDDYEDDNERSSFIKEGSIRSENWPSKCFINDYMGSLKLFWDNMIADCVEITNQALDWWIHKVTNVIVDVLRKEAHFYAKIKDLLD